MNRLILLALVCLTFVPPLRAAATQPQPNILIIFTDDMRFSDVGC